MKRSSLAALSRQTAAGNDDPGTISEAIYRRLRSEIVWGELALGAPLRSGELRGRYEVGVSHLREALFRLASERRVMALLAIESGGDG